MTPLESIRAENAVKLLSRLRRENPQLFRAVQIWAEGALAGRGDAAVIGAESAGEPPKTAELLTSSAPDSNGQLSEIIQEIKDNNQQIREIIELQHAVLLKFLQLKTEKKQ